MINLCYDLLMSNQKPSTIRNEYRDAFAELIKARRQFAVGMMSRRELQKVTTRYVAACEAIDQLDN